MVTPPQHHPHRLFLDMEFAMPPIGLNSTIGTYNSQANFDDNMVIVLAVLLCALICSLGMNSAIRYIIRCGYHLGFWTQEEIPAIHQLTSTTTPTTGLNKSALRQIPVMVYEPGLNLSGTDCSICLGEFEEGEKVRVVPHCSHVFHAMCIDTWLEKVRVVPHCSHVFHAMCIDTWLLSNSSCPLCRRALELHSWVA